MNSSDTSNLPAQAKTAVVLLQLGGPDSLESVEPFLYNLFIDPDIIDFPGAFVARTLLARIISRTRSKKVAEYYSEIGGKSPILELTQKQAGALEGQLMQHGMNAKVFIAMRYWHPLTESVIKEIQSGGFKRILLLPLYPHFSRATTYSSLNEWNRQAQSFHLTIPTQHICCYPNHQGFIGAWIDTIEQTFNRFANIAPEDIDLLFTAHSVPLNYIQQGDPYQLQVEETVRRIMAGIRLKSPHTICYQSKVGPVRWLRPSLVEAIELHALNNRRNLMIIPVSFVTDHIETLHEINIRARKLATTLGVLQFEMTPALNDHPQFIECLADLVLQTYGKDMKQTTCSLLWKNNSGRPKPTFCKNLD